LPCQLLAQTLRATWIGPASGEGSLGFLIRSMDEFKKDEAAVVRAEPSLQELLERQVRAGLFDRDPARIANLLVHSAWSKKPELFDGNRGQRPHKIATAAFALAAGIEGAREVSSEPPYALVICLGTILSEVQTNGHLYPLNSLDVMLIESAAVTYAKAAEELDTPL